MERNNRTLMHIDGSHAVRIRCRIILEEAGWRVVSCRDGEEALEHVRAEGHGIDMIMLDMMLPGINSLSVTRQLRANPHWRDLPIVMSSTRSSPSVVGAARSAGLDGWAVKPFRPRNLTATLERVCAQKEPGK